MLGKRADKDHRHAALTRPNTLHLAGKRRSSEFHVVQEVILRARLGAGTVDHEVASSLTTQNRSLTRELRTGHVDDRALTQFKGADDLGVLAWLILPEQHCMTKTKLTLDPILDFMRIYVHGPTS